ncbi:MAG TPA: trimethylamine methyltransferase family protein [Spirochaetia bacterium]|nr:trimethylamine methyltransferase family protein [Spirochaetia bacterium]
MDAGIAWGALLLFEPVTERLSQRLVSLTGEAPPSIDSSTSREEPIVSSDTPRAVPRLHLMDRDQCETIHQASLEILRKTGIRVHHDEALELLREAGCVVSEGNRVRFPPGLVEWALAQAPSTIALCDRGSSNARVRLRPGESAFGPGSDCPNYLDPRDGKRRPFTLRDLEDCVRLADALPQISFLMSMGIPRDYSGNAYRRQYATLIEGSTKPVVFVCNDAEDCRAIAGAAAAVAGGMEELRLNPTLVLYSEPTTPLQQSTTATEKLLYMASEGLPVVHSPAPMMGSTAPATLAGGLALGNAEVLSSIVIHQRKRPGAPFLYGSGLHHMDMKTSISVYGAPEFQLARVAVASMGRHYGLPTWGYAGHSDSILFDEQAAADAVFSVQTALLSGTNLIHDVGYLEAGLTTSPEMMVFTADMIDMMIHFTDGFGMSPDELALDVIHAVGPGGNYLGEDHTMRHFREAWQPVLFDRQRFDGWKAHGSRGLRARLQERTLEMLSSHAGSPLSDRLKLEVERILEL